MFLLIIIYCKKLKYIIIDFILLILHIDLIIMSLKSINIFDNLSINDDSDDENHDYKFSLLIDNKKILMIY